MYFHMCAAGMAIGLTAGLSLAEPVSAQDAKVRCLSREWRKLTGAATLDQHINACTQEIQTDKETTPLKYAFRGYYYIEKFDYDRAIKDFSRAIELKSDSVAFSYLYRAIAHDRKSEYDRAKQDYDQAVKLDPNVGQYYTATEGADERVNRDPDNAVVRHIRGIALSEVGAYDRAIKDFDQVIKLKPGHVSAYRNRALALYKSGNYDRAIKDYSEAIKYDSTTAADFIGRGDAYNKKGDVARMIEDYGSAIALYEKTIKLEPGLLINTVTLVHALRDRGSAYAHSGRYDLAIADYNRALKLYPPDVASLVLRGLVKEKMGDKAGSEADKSAAQRMNPKIAQKVDEREQTPSKETPVIEPVPKQSSSKLDAIIGPGLLLVTTDFSPEIGGGGTILPNDRVDVQLTRKEGGSELKKTILENIRVMAVDQKIEERNGRRIITSATATLAVSPSQAEARTRSKQLDKLSLCCIRDLK